MCTLLICGCYLHKLYIVGLNMWSVSVSYGVDRSDELNNVKADVYLMMYWEWKCLSYWTCEQMVANCIISELDALLMD